MVWLKWIIPKIAGVHDLLAERLTRQHNDGTWGPKIRHEIQAVQETKHPTALSHPVRPVQFTNSVYFSFPRWISFAQALSLETKSIKDNCRTVGLSGWRKNELRAYKKTPSWSEK